MTVDNQPRAATAAPHRGTAPTATYACPACADLRIERFFALHGLPVHGQAVCRTREEALALQRGDQVLAVCHGCGFVFNVEYDASLLDYSGDHEESQAFSPAFRAFASDLAQGWVRRFGLEGELVVEVGCGKGDFLQLLAAAGVGRAHGIDPGVDVDRLPSGGRITAEKAYYAPSELTRQAAAIVCRHTLEHIPDVGAFIASIRAGVDPDRCRAILFEVPGLSGMLEGAAFWDLQYEHCSLFTAGSLRALFERHDLDVLDLRRVYNGQYLIIEADPAPGRGTRRETAPEPTVEEVVADCREFGAAVRAKLDHWEMWFAQQAADGREAVVWGGGAKGVVFLNNLPAGTVRRVVDINKGLQGNWLAGVGIPIVAPAQLASDPPDTVVLMNAVYLDEVRAMLDELGMRDVELIAV